MRRWKQCQRCANTPATPSRLVNNNPAHHMPNPPRNFQSMSASRPSVKRYTSKANGGMGGLFGEPERPAGSRYIPDVVSPEEEKGLVQQFEKLPLKPFEFHGYKGNRRIYTFGHKYIFAGQEPRADASIPDYLRPLIDIASQISGMPATAFQHPIVTEYTPGAGIGWHRDRPSHEGIGAGA